MKASKSIILAVIILLGLFLPSCQLSHSSQACYSFGKPKQQSSKHHVKLEKSKKSQKKRIKAQKAAKSPFAGHTTGNRGKVAQQTPLYDTLTLISKSLWIAEPNADPLIIASTGSWREHNNSSVLKKSDRVVKALKTLNYKPKKRKKKVKESSRSSFRLGWVIAIALIVFIVIIIVYANMNAGKKDYDFRPFG